MGKRETNSSLGGSGLTVVEVVGITVNFVRKVGGRNEAGIGIGSNILGGTVCLGVVWIDMKVGGRGLTVLKGVGWYVIVFGFCRMGVVS